MALACSRKPHPRDTILLRVADDHIAVEEEWDGETALPNTKRPPIRTGPDESSRRDRQRFRREPPAKGRRPGQSRAAIGCFARPSPGKRTCDGLDDAVSNYPSRQGSRPAPRNPSPMSHEERPAGRPRTRTSRATQTENQIGPREDVDRPGSWRKIVANGLGFRPTQILLQGLSMLPSQTMAKNDCHAQKNRAPEPTRPVEPHEEKTLAL